MGRGSKFIITGDVTQIDLPNKIPSGLIQALNILDKTKGIAKVMLNKTDVIRNPVVETIIEKYANPKSNK
jgi:phosphate starvation-inducible PhoH-like protein